LQYRSYTSILLGHRVVAHATAGRKTEALQIIAQLQTISSKRYVSPYGLAQIYAALNDKEQTFKWLQIAYDDRAVWMTYLAVDPVFDGFRSDQRFQDLLRRVRLLPWSRIPHAASQSLEKRHRSWGFVSAACMPGRAPRVTKHGPLSARRSVLIHLTPEIKRLDSRSNIRQPIVLAL